MRNSRNAYTFGCETRQKMNERCNELASMLDSTNAKIEALTEELKEESSRNRAALNRVLGVVQKVMPDAMDQVNDCHLYMSFMCTEYFCRFWMVSIS